ncbi:hypothetical protein A2707_02880 [Candidatus Saccharibacteria bacterium RIFCSPHIGHO2_01_FULL_45_15]|nr:MAG: hypothetical protein A2707_02880 [Candidatus Saccharibacteria bacterium RIFCSPHIGHO2_01_FULL_45_15]OGL27058.1 MAG: hypothetical protein A3C39_00730 [Candidatus Saccharibacteria bacterium RIFCSPHIGHO2_02_FULL_46_12]OGL31869.1 MAG: hypothetical protein A3E76_03475 [Candidatus Saccharibacteria bacterium RIFCSPHIGHO2_12_FULL_44_22]
MTTVLFVPGFREDKKSRNYTAMIDAIEKAGYNVVFADIKWKRTTIKDWTAQLDLIYKEYNPNDTILAGFSFGAMTVFTVAAKQNPSELWLFSLSPYFKEDIESDDMQDVWLKNIGKNRTTAFSELHFSKMAKSIRCKTLIFVGQMELDMWPDMKNRTNEAKRIIENSHLSIIADTGHDVADSKYIDALVNVLS